MTATFTDDYSSAAHTFSSSSDAEVTGGNLQFKEQTIYGDHFLWWAMEGNSNDSINSNNGTDSNMSYSSSTYFQGSESAEFNGSTSYITFPQWFGSSNISTGSISFWMKLNSVGSEQRLVAYNEDGIFIQIRATFPGGDEALEYLVWDGAATGAVVEVNDLTLWHHVCLTFNENDSNKFYIDGLLVNTTSSGTYAEVGSTGRILGASRDALANFVDGWIDDLHVWDRVITEDEVKTMLNSRRSLDTATLQYPTIATAYKTAGFSDTSVTRVIQITETNGGTADGSTGYTVSTDGATWQISNGDGLTSAGANDYSTLADINSSLLNYDTSGNDIYVRLTLIGDGSQQQQISETTIDYYRYTLTLNGQNRS